MLNTMKTQKRVLIALYNMGGPSDQEGVEPFLRALFNDPDLLEIPLGRLLQDFVANKIIQKRLHEVKERYQQMGGGSPQMRITQSVADRLKSQLLQADRAPHPLFASPEANSSESPFQLAGVTTLYRYSEPRAKTVLQECVSKRVDELWLLSQYPHCARATTGTSLREIGLEQAHESDFSGIRVRSFASYGDDPAFIDLWVQRLRQSWADVPAGSKHLIISAHNLPLSYVAQGDPYPAQIRRTAQEVTRRLGLYEGIDWTLCWQSAVGPVKWMSPTTENTIERLAAKGIENALVWPLAFVSDHIETQVEIDLEYAEFAKKLGIKNFTRVANLNSDDDFLQFMTSYVKGCAEHLLQHADTPLLRDFDACATGPFCRSQPAGCLCANFYFSGRQGLTRGKAYVKVDSGPSSE